jgi:hypothetical protein
MFQFAIRTAVLFVILAPAATGCFAQVGDYLTAQEEAVCKTDFKIRESTGHDEVSLRGFAWPCSQAMLGRQKAEFAALRKSMRSRGGQEARAYEALLAAFLNYHTRFLDYSTRTCAGGTGCGVFSAMDEVHDNRDFLAITNEIKDGAFPISSPLDLSAADDSLNKTYQAALKAIACPLVMTGEIPPCDEDLRVVERAWVRYRDAWVTAAAVLWPRVDADSLGTFLTRQRIHELF